MDSLKRELGRRLEYVRRQNERSIREVSEKTGIPESTLFQYEKGMLTIPAERLQILADYYGVSMEWFVTGRESEGELKRRWPLGYQILSRAGARLTEDEKRKLIEVCEYLIENPRLLDTVDVDALVEEAEKRDNETSVRSEDILGGRHDGAIPLFEEKPEVSRQAKRVLGKVRRTRRRR